MGEVPYIAGLMDGEGSFSIVGCNINGFYPRVVLYNTHFETVKWVRDYFDIGSIQTIHPHKNHLGKKIVYRWYLTHRNVIFVVSKLIPYLKIKKKQAELILQFPLGTRGKKVSDEKYLKRKELQSKIVELNTGHLRRKL